MTHYKKLVGDKCHLSPCVPEGADKWAEWFNGLMGILAEESASTNVRGVIA